MPELSCVIEYDPSEESEEDMLRMAESVPANLDRQCMIALIISKKLRIISLKLAG